ncbi:hypothetical protein, partial [Gottfriedia acidiceleris]|uniref:hypothetical protein n=1 Tax=Gottfriedia acidiceleris TaxID=371036 RepID=UPI002FFEE86A
APLSVDVPVYTQYTYNKKTIKKLKKKKYWTKVSNNNIKNLNQRVTEYNNSILKYPVPMKSRQNLLKYPVVINDNCYYYVKRDKEKQDQYAIFFLNPSEKKLYLLEYYF